VAKIASVKIAPDNEPEPVAVVSAPTVIPIEAKVSNRGETSPSFANRGLASSNIEERAWGDAGGRA